MRLKWSGFLVVGIVTANLFSVSPVFAQKDMGIRAGVSIDPEQFYFGGHITTGPVVDRLFFRPNAEIGVGDHVAVVWPSMVNSRISFRWRSATQTPISEAALR